MAVSVQAHDGQLLHMLPGTGVTVQISFYDKPAEEVRHSIACVYDITQCMNQKGRPHHDA